MGCPFSIDILEKEKCLRILTQRRLFSDRTNGVRKRSLGRSTVCGKYDARALALPFRYALIYVASACNPFRSFLTRAIRDSKWYYAR